ncbi:hypothetical protein JTB14_031902 [Gonioctena quinquepunctata]|nr:hypothetical protein JTB14_031902 [Gonioctena quinquepunctata]
MEKSIPVENSSELEIFPIDSLRINTKENKYGNIDKAPVDKCYVIHFLFLLFGIMHLLPISFFILAKAKMSKNHGVFTYTCKILGQTGGHQPT